MLNALAMPFAPLLVTELNSQTPKFPFNPFAKPFMSTAHQNYMYSDFPLKIGMHFETPDVRLVSQGKSTQPILISPLLTRPFISLLHTAHEIDPFMISVEASPSTESSSEAGLFFDLSLIHI